MARDEKGRFMKGHNLGEIINRSYINCINCGKKIRTFKSRPRKFCNHSCAIKYQFKEGIRKVSENFKKSKKGLKKGQTNSGSFTSERMKGNQINKGRKLTPEHIKKCLKRNPKSSLEIKFEDLIKQLGLPYKFVGNGEIMVARKVPDFVHKNKRIAVEVFYRKHKEMFREGLEVWKAERARIFTKEGWKLIFFDETQVNEQTLKNKLGISNRNWK